MALRRLLLYTDGGNTSDAKFNFNGNITFDCITNCVGMCIYDLCIRPPPLSPVTSPIDHNSDDMTSIDAQRREIFPTLIITIVSAVAGSFGLLTLYAYFRFRRRARRRHLPPEAAVSVGSAIDGDETGSDDSPGGEIDHHIWHIRTQGLDDSTIASITSWMYKSSDGLINSSDCSVCLGEFHDGELVRLLPKCSHAFHLPCIDMWLRSHVNCPLCRAPIVYPEVVTEPATNPASPQTAVITVSTELEPGSHAPLENLQLVALPGENSSVGSEIGIDIHASEGCSSQSSNPVLPHNNSLEEEDRLQPIRRSISIDFLSLEAVTREERAADELQEPGGRASLNREKSGSFLKGNLFRKLPKKMERSLSSQSLQWIFPKYGRPQNSVLPL